MAGPVATGDVLGGKYRVDRVLGEGGMGVVVAATHLHLDQRVALKFMLPEAFKNPDALARFAREAKAAVRLRSEHVARVLDTGTFANGAPYIVMEFLEGTDLSAELARGGPMAPQVAAEYIVQACEAIAEAHSLGIVHRDLKPANLFLTRRADGSPLVKVLDFGISKASSLGDSSLNMTKTAAVMGSPLYMSPEQMKSTKDVDARSDVWSLGIILYELLGGRTPFEAETLGGLMAAVLTAPPAPLATVRPGLPPSLYALVDRCLCKDRDLRCQDVGEIARGLAPFCPPRVVPIVDRISGVLGQRTAGSMSVSPASPLVQTAPDASARSGAPAPAQTAGGWGTTGSTTRKRKTGVWLAVGSVALIVGAAAAVVALRSRSTIAAGVQPLVTATGAPPAASGGTVTATSTDTETAPPQAPASSSAAASAPAASASAPSTSRPGSAPGTRHPSPGAPAKPPPAHVASAAPLAPAPPPAAPAPPPTVQKPGILDTSN